jgi:hypothetical protein
MPSKCDECLVNICAGRRLPKSSSSSVASSTEAGAGANDEAAAKRPSSSISIRIRSRSGDGVRGGVTTDPVEAEDATNPVEAEATDPVEADDASGIAQRRATDCNVRRMTGARGVGAVAVSARGPMTLRVSCEGNEHRTHAQKECCLCGDGGVERCNLSTGFECRLDQVDQVGGTRALAMRVFSASSFESSMTKKTPTHDERLDAAEELFEPAGAR